MVLKSSKIKIVITATKVYENQPMLLCEASYPSSIFPKTGGIRNFFHQIINHLNNIIILFNKKINLIVNDELDLNTLGRENNIYLNNLLDEKLL